MERTEERGWYQQEREWTGTLRSSESNAEDRTSTALTSEVVLPAESYSVPADESRPKCSICGLMFNMFFDNDQGDWMYKDCREIDVLNDDAAEKESELILVHVTCWRKIGSPVQLTRDQVL